MLLAISQERKSPRDQPDKTHSQPCANVYTHRFIHIQPEQVSKGTRVMFSCSTHTKKLRGHKALFIPWSGCVTEMYLKVKLPAFCRLCPRQVGRERMGKSQQEMDLTNGIKFSLCPPFPTKWSKALNRAM